MGADVSRVRMDPLRDHSGVGLQQGRLLLDGDFNEQVAIVDRRLRALAVDAGAPVISALTPDAFKIFLSGGEVTIGRGRMYVDGLLAENHGDPEQPDFDPVLAEPTRQGSVAFDAQPYGPTPEGLPDSGSPDSAGPHLVFLDVWQRELTQLNAPDLVEPAVGVDTTTRTQVVWQVRILPDVGESATCDGPVEGWADLVAPSGARLTTDTVPVDPADDACELPPTGGFRGLENHAYRVELHDATHFKWSRDNASVGSAVVEVLSGTELRLATLGRDNVLRIAEDDWVEILDDRREFAQLPGDIRQVSVDDATNTITVSPALSADLIPSGSGEDTAALRHLRVVKWDSGLVDVPPAGTAAVLEHGITVEFSGDPGRPGDHWIFAARSGLPIEKLVDAAPLGIHHHYARLALITFPDSAIDCRPSEPPAEGGCGCEICVTPEGHAKGTRTIQDAVDAVVAAGGGTVVLCPGVYPLTEPVRLENATSVVLRGHGPASTLVTAGSAIVVQTGVDVAISRLGVLSAGSAPGVLLSDCSACTVEEVTVNQTLGTVDGPRVAIGLAGVQIFTLVRRCVLLGAIGVGVVPGGQELKTLYTLGLRIEDSIAQCSSTGVDLTGLCVHSGELRIAGNMILGTSDAAIAATGLVMTGETLLDGVLTVAGNDIRTEGLGIHTGGQAVIVDNEIAAGRRGVGGHAIFVANEPPGVQPGSVQIIGNRVNNAGGFGILVEAPLASLLCKQNVIRGAAGGIVVRGPGPKEHVSIDNNHVLELTPPDLSDEPTVGFRAGTMLSALAPSVLYGIAVTGAGVAQLAGNLVDGVGADTTEVSFCIGLVATLNDDVRMTGNTLRRIGTPTAGESGLAIGIGVGSSLAATSLEQNTVHSGPSGPVRRPRWQAMIVAGSGSGDAGRAVASAGPIRVVRAGTAGVVALDGAWLYARAAAEITPALNLTGNTLQGGGDAVAVLLQSDGDTILSGNYAAQPPDADHPAVELTAPVAVVSNNRAAGGRPSMRLNVSQDAASVIGNITSGDITVSGVPVRQTGKPWSQLNPVLP